MLTTSMPNIFTRDIEKAVTFYRDQLGFSQNYQVPGEGRPEHVVLALGDSLLALSTSSAVTAVGLDPTTGNSFELVVWCADVYSETARLRAAGAPAARSPITTSAAIDAPTLPTPMATGSRSSMPIDGTDRNRSVS